MALGLVVDVVLFRECLADGLSCGVLRFSRWSACAVFVGLK